MTNCTMHDLFPPITTEALLAFQFSSWYPRFSHITIKSTTIKPLSDSFTEYLLSDSVFVPIGSENVLHDDDQYLSDDESKGDDGPQYSFPDLDRQIRAVVDEYGAIFPKLNFSSPRDAAWILPAGSPMKCTAPADVYILLKSSNFISHDLDPITLFEGCKDAHQASAPQLELTLRKWFTMDPSRELRCFVRGGQMIAICQRHENYYEYLNDSNTQSRIVDSINSTWKSKISSTWGSVNDYVFDVIMTRSLDSLHVIDFNPYLPRTDALLFTYEELLDIYVDALRSFSEIRPIFRVITSMSDPRAGRNAPTHQHNMLPREALELSAGRDIIDFARAWKEEVARATTGDSEEE